MRRAEDSIHGPGKTGVEEVLRHHSFGKGGSYMTSDAKNNDKAEKKTNEHDMEIVNLVENLDSTLRRAKNLKMTNIAFIDCLRQVNQQKVFAVEEARQLFKNRIEVLVKAKNYELQ